MAMPDIFFLLNFEILIISAVILDLLMGDPQWFPHPVRLIGKLCVKFEILFRGIIKNEKVSGLITSISINIVVIFSISVALYISGIIHLYLHIIIALTALYLLIAIKDLFAHSREVYTRLFPIEDLVSARKSLSYIVGRDTEKLNAEEISRGCVETVAENMVDGITAPLFWAVSFSLLSLFLPVSPPAAAVIGMALYKSINTMDSMFGYKNEKYINFGWASARIDDVMNYLPARLSGLCIIIGAFFSGCDAKQSAKIFFRDRRNHSSPNAGHSEAAVAGALNLQLGGESWYFGQKVVKPTIGDKVRSAAPADILRTNRLVMISTVIFIAVILFSRKVCAWAVLALL